MFSIFKKFLGMLVLSILLAVTAEARSPKIWIIGDSIFKSYDSQYAPLAGVGQMIKPFCKRGVKVRNRAVSGTSTKSFRDCGYWKDVIDEIRKGDYLLIHFGHNDQKRNKPKVYAEAETAYSQNLSKYIEEARSKGARPVLITSMCRRYFRDGHLIHTLKDYPKYCRLVAKKQKVPLLDLNRISFVKVDSMGEVRSKSIYNHIPENSKYTYWTTEQNKKSHTDNSHLNFSGAKLAAKWLIEDTKKQKLELAKLFK